MPTASTAAKRRHSRSASGLIAPRAKIWFEANGENVFCRGLADVLDAVERTHSIKAAAEEVGRSYRHIWARIKRTEEALGEKLVAAQVGGRGAERSELTPLAIDLVREFREMRAEIHRLIDQVYARRLAGFKKKHSSRK